MRGPAFTPPEFIPVVAGPADGGFVPYLGTEWQMHRLRLGRSAIYKLMLRGDAKWRYEFARWGKELK